MININMGLITLLKINFIMKYQFFFFRNFFCDIFLEAFYNYIFPSFGLKSFKSKMDGTMRFLNVNIFSNPFSF